MSKRLNMDQVRKILEDHGVSQSNIDVALRQAVRWSEYEISSGDMSRVIKILYYAEPANYFTVGIGRHRP